MFTRTASALALSLTLLFSTFFLSGCSSKPLLTRDNTYNIVYISPSGETKSEPIDLPWNSNMAVMQKVLLESSFVLSDLHTPNDLNESPQTTTSSICLKVNFANPKSMTFVVDHQDLTLNVQSLQIEVEGSHVGLVTINQTIILQGIDNPNLQPAFKDLTDMLHNQNIKNLSST